MICNCGGRTISARLGDTEATLDWQQCGACGRCAAFRLKRNGCEVVTGETARRMYRTHEAHRLQQPIAAREPT